MAVMPAQCPSCQRQLVVATLRCRSCETSLEGSFDMPVLLLLPAADVDFVVQFVKVSGSLKEMAARRGQSYPTIRNRLNEIIRRLESEDLRLGEERYAILDAIAKGAMTVAEGEMKLKEIAL